MELIGLLKEETVFITIRSNFSGTLESLATFSLLKKKKLDYSVSSGKVAQSFSKQIYL